MKNVLEDETTHSILESLNSFDGLFNLMCNEMVTFSIVLVLNTGYSTVGAFGPVKNLGIALLDRQIDDSTFPTSFASLVFMEVM